MSRRTRKQIHQEMRGGYQLSRREWLRTTLTGGLLAGTPPAMACQQNSAGATIESTTSGGKGITVYAATPTVVDQATLFAFDDLSIPYRQNLYLEMHPPKKHPNNPLLRREKGRPDEYRAQFYGSVIRHDGKFKMWYVAADNEAIQSLPSRAFYGWRPAYAESQDGIHWIKPNLGLVDYHGSRNNNLVLIEPPEVMGLHLIVLLEPDDPDPSKQFKMMLLVRTHIAGKKAATSVPLYSGDGLRWRLAVKAMPVNYALPEESLVLPPEHFEQGGLYKWQGIYHLTGQQIDPWVWLPNGQPCGRQMTVLRSPDLVHWSGAKTLSFVRYGYRSAPTGHGEEAHEGAGIWHRGNALVGVYGLWHGAARTEDRRMDLGLLISNDGVHFREPVPNFVFIPRGADRSWDARGLVQGQAFENVGEETYIWYGSWDLSATKVVAHGEIGLVTLRRDGFGSLAPKNPSRPASFMSCSLKANGPAKLWVNAEGLSEEGRLRVELIDEAERALPDYSGDNSTPVQQSGLRTRVSWKGKDQIRALGSPFRIRVSFEGKERQSIKFYALYLTE